MVVIRLSRTGSKNRPMYRVAVADSRKKPKGRFIEIIGHYSPLSKNKEAKIDAKIDLEKYKSWIGKGARPSGRVKSLAAKLNEK